MCKIEFHAVGLKGVQAHPQKFWFDENLGKMYENLCKIPLCALFYKMAPKMKVRTFFEVIF